jgi:hypothetical protein
MTSDDGKPSAKASSARKTPGTPTSSTDVRDPSPVDTMWLSQELAQAEAAVARGTVARTLTPHAVHAEYRANSRTVNVGLSNGAAFTFPVSLVEKLAGAEHEALAPIELSPLGTGLHWPVLDVDLTVEGLLLGVFGNRAWTRQQAAVAGRATSGAKAAAARANGTRGGRPRKQGAVAS